MSFSLTTDQIRARTKTVTRRLGWRTLEAGATVRACRKCQGLKPGERVEPLATLRIISVEQVRLGDCSDDDAVREGFPQLTGQAFAQMFAHAMRCDLDTLVTRIEFEYVDP